MTSYAICAVQRRANSPLVRRKMTTRNLPMCVRWPHLTWRKSGEPTGRRAAEQSVCRFHHSRLDIAASFNAHVQRSSCQVKCAAAPCCALWCQPMSDENRSHSFGRILPPPAPETSRNGCCELCDFANCDAALSADNSRSNSRRSPPPCSPVRAPSSLNTARSRAPSGAVHGQDPLSAKFATHS